MTGQYPLSVSTLRRPLRMLLDAYRCADDLNAADQEFAVRIAELRRSRISDGALRWLCGKGYAEHLVEMTAPADPVRKYIEGNTTAFRSTSCFVLTNTGVEFAETVSRIPRCQNNRCETSAPNAEPELGIPHWNADIRELRVGHVLIRTMATKTEISGH